MVINFLYYLILIFSSLNAKNIGVSQINEISILNNFQIISKSTQCHMCLEVSDILLLRFSFVPCSRSSLAQRFSLYKRRNIVYNIKPHFYNNFIYYHNNMDYFVYNVNNFSNIVFSPIKNRMCLNYDENETNTVSFDSLFTICDIADIDNLFNSQLFTLVQYGYQQDFFEIKGQFYNENNNNIVLTNYSSFIESIYMFPSDEEFETASVSYKAKINNDDSSFTASVPIGNYSFKIIFSNCQYKMSTIADNTVNIASCNVNTAEVYLTDKLIYSISLKMTENSSAFLIKDSLKKIQFRNSDDSYYIWYDISDFPLSINREDVSDETLKIYQPGYLQPQELVFSCEENIKLNIYYNSSPSVLTEENNINPDFFPNTIILSSFHTQTEDPYPGLIFLDKINKVICNTGFMAYNYQAIKEGNLFYLLFLGYCNYIDIDITGSKRTITSNESDGFCYEMTTAFTLFEDDYMNCTSDCINLSLQCDEDEILTSLKFIRVNHMESDQKPNLFNYYKRTLKLQGDCMKVDIISSYSKVSKTTNTELCIGNIKFTSILKPREALNGIHWYNSKDSSNNGYFTIESKVALLLGKLN